MKPHSIQHKSSNFSKKTSSLQNWKEDLRNKCISRIKSSRNQMINNLRQKRGGSTKKQLNEIINTEIQTNFYDNLNEREYFELMQILESELLEDLEKEGFFFSSKNKQT